MNDGSPLALYADELRRARTEAGLSQEALGKAIGYSASLVAGVEQARRNPGPDFTTRCDDILKTGGRLRRVRRAMLEEAFVSAMRDLAPVEQEAVAIRTFEPIVVPGLLQTEDYARALLAGGRQVQAEDVDEQVAVRMGRQEILTRKNPVLLTAVIDDHVLRRPIGGPQVMHAQLERLVELGALPNVRLHCVPAQTGAYAGVDGAFLVATLPDGHDVCYFDNPLGGQLVERPDDIMTLRNAWEDIRGLAFPHGQTVALIKEVLKSWS